QQAKGFSQGCARYLQARAQCALIQARSCRQLTLDNHVAQAFCHGSGQGAPVDGYVDVFCLRGCSKGVVSIVYFHLAYQLGAACLARSWLPRKTGMAPAGSDEPVSCEVKGLC